MARNAHEPSIRFIYKIIAQCARFGKCEGPAAIDEAAGRIVGQVEWICGGLLEAQSAWEVCMRYGLHGILVVLVLVLPIARGNAQKSLLALFEGEPSDVRTIAVGSWGGAECSEWTDFTLTGRMSIRVRTSNDYRGARVDFIKPVDLGPCLADPNAYLQYVVYSAVRAGKTTASVSAPRSGPGPAMPGGPYKPGGGGAVTSSSEELGYSPITDIRTILFFEEGTLVVDRQKVEAYRQDEAGWARFNVPLAKFKSQKQLPGYHLKRLRGAWHPLGRGIRAPFEHDPQLRVLVPGRHGTLCQGVPGRHGQFSPPATTTASLP